MMGMLSLSNGRDYINNKYWQGKAGRVVRYWLGLSRVGIISLHLMTVMFLTACFEINVDENSATISKKVPAQPTQSQLDNDSFPSAGDVFDAIAHNSQWQLPRIVHTTALNQQDRVMTADSTLFSTGTDQGFMVVTWEIVKAANNELERKQQVFRFEGGNNWYEVNPLGNVSIDSNIDILTNDQGISYALWKDQDGFLWINDFNSTSSWQVPQAVNKNSAALAHQMIFDADGQLVVIWIEQSSDKGTLLYAQRFAGEADLPEVISLVITATQEMSAPVRLAEGSLLLALRVMNGQGNAIHMARITPEFTWQESLWTVNLDEHTLLENLSDQAILLSYNEAASASAMNVYALTSVTDTQTLLKLPFDLDNGWGDRTVIDFVEPVDKPDQIEILQATVNEAGDVVLVWYDIGDDLQYFAQIISHDNKQYWMTLRPFANASRQMNGLDVRYESDILLASWLESDRLGQQQLVFKQSHIMSGHNTTELVHGFSEGEIVLQYPGLTFFGSQPPYLSWISMSTLNDGRPGNLDWMVSQRQMTTSDMIGSDSGVTRSSTPPPPPSAFPPPMPVVPAAPSYQTWMEPSVVFEQNIMNNQVAEIRGPQVAALDDGSLYVSATSLSDYDLFAGRFSSIENLVLVNSNNSQWQQTTPDNDELLTAAPRLQLAYSASSGDVYAYWKDDNTMFRRPSPTGEIADTLYINHYSVATGWQQVEAIVDVGWQYWVVVDETGIASVVWIDATDQTMLNVQRYVPGEGLGGVEALAIGKGIGSVSQLALDKNGWLYTVWVEFDEFPILMAPVPPPPLEQSLGGEGSGRSAIGSTVLNAADVKLPPQKIGLSARLMMAKFDGLAWSQAQIIADYQNSDLHLNPVPDAIRGLAFDEHNQPVIISALLVPDINFKQALFAIHFDAAGQPLAPVNIDYNLGSMTARGNGFMSARVVYDQQGNVVVVWDEYSYSREGSGHALYANQYVPGEGWQIPSRLTGEGSLSGTRHSFEVVMNQSSEIVVLIRSDYFDYAVLSTQHYQPDTGWYDAPEMVAVQMPSDLTSVSLALDNTGRAVLAWRDIAGSDMSRTYRILTTTTRSQ